MKGINFIFGIHNHQPVGNFEYVFKRTFEDCYLPFIKKVFDYPAIRLTVHFSGPLFEWIENNRPDYFDLLRTLIDRNQIEFMAGGFYEPLLPVIPERDALGQLRMMKEYIEDRFGVTPLGIWLAERVWEPKLPQIIGKAGFKYVAVDDTHFYYAGLRKEDMTGYYITEDNGWQIAVFPIDKELRYRIPFRLPEEAIEYFSSIATEDGSRVVTLADDGEKFGVWPGTYKWVYKDGYLDRFFTLLSRNAEWLHMISFKECMERFPPSGRVYLPTASYDEMMEWALPVKTQAMFEQIIERYKSRGEYEQMRPFLRGGFWRNFLVKYTESNRMYSKMVYISNKIDARRGQLDISRIEESSRELYRGQCNCAYWHGLFGGLYLNYLRHGVYQHLINAETIIEDQIEDIKIDTIDYDFDGFDEVIVSSNLLNIYIKPSYGAHIVELDLREKNFNLSNTLTRRPEVYHRKLNLTEDEVDPDVPKSIHNIVALKEDGLQGYLYYDRYDRASLIDHFFSGHTTLSQVYSGNYRELGDFVDKPYLVSTDEKNEIALSRMGYVEIEGRKHKIEVSKTLKFTDPGILSIRYHIHNHSRKVLPLWFGVEFNLTLLAGTSPDRFYIIDDRKEPMDVMDETSDVKSVDLVDEYNKFKVTLGWRNGALLWRYPVETVSHSESGIERTYQGSCIIPSWRFTLGSGSNHIITLYLGIEDL